MANEAGDAFRAVVAERDALKVAIRQIESEHRTVHDQLLLLARAMVAQLESMIGDEANESEEESR